MLVLGCWAGGRILADSDHGLANAKRACCAALRCTRWCRCSSAYQALRENALPGSSGSQATFARCAALCLRAPGMDSAWIRHGFDASCDFFFATFTRFAHFDFGFEHARACKRASPPPGWRVAPHNCWHSPHACILAASVYLLGWRGEAELERQAWIMFRLERRLAVITPLPCLISAA